jgi:hypothetical protein
LKLTPSETDGLGYDDYGEDDLGFDDEEDDEEGTLHEIISL